MTVMQRKDVNPIAHLTADDVEKIGRRLEEIRAEVIAARGERDAAYIRRVIDVQRKLELGSRIVLLASLFPPAWLLGTAGLSVAKILENMEIGHNVMHGQWDWMRDPKIHSTTWEWDNASPPTSGSTRTTSCTTRTPTSSARTTTWATASCGSTRTSAGIRSTSLNRCGASSTPASSSSASPPTIWSYART